jgi:DNA-binding PadR family transcriptional regulator
MGRERRLSSQAARVVRLLADKPARWRFGYEMLGLLGLKSGSLYPILMRLADRGLLEARWDQDGLPGRPPRHLYRLTPDGLAVAADLAPREGLVSPGDPEMAR